MVDPMDSFQVKNIVPINLFRLDVSITNSSIFMFLVVAVICGILWFATIDGGSFQQNCRLLLRNRFALLAGL